MRHADSFDEFYRATALGMFRYGYALTGDRADAQDVVQEAYARAWRRWRMLVDHPAPAAWVRRVISRLAADRWRRLAGLRNALARTGPPPPVRAPSEDTVLLVEALRRVPVRQRETLALHYLLGLSVEEIAAETGVAAGTVKSRLSRGRALLAQRLGDLAPRSPRPSKGSTVAGDAR